MSFQGEKEKGTKKVANTKKSHVTQDATIARVMGNKGSPSAVGKAPSPAPGSPTRNLSWQTSAAASPATCPPIPGTSKWSPKSASAKPVTSKSPTPAPTQAAAPRQPVRPAPRGTRAPTFSPLPTTPSPRNQPTTASKPSRPASAATPKAASNPLQQQLAEMQLKLAAAELAAQQAKQQAADLSQQLADSQRKLEEQGVAHAEELAQFDSTIAGLKQDVKTRDGWIQSWSAMALKHMSHTDWPAAQVYKPGTASPVGPIKAHVGVSL